MADKYIGFKPDMVRAILRHNNPKTQTRRLHSKLKYQVGDIVRVRETARVELVNNLNNTNSVKLQYLADGAYSSWIDWPERLNSTPVTGKCLAYGTFKEACRIKLKITGVREEKLQAITEEDAIAEGILEHGGLFGVDTGGEFPYFPSAIKAFINLWNSINSEPFKMYCDNPGVKVYEIKRVD